MSLTKPFETDRLKFRLLTLDDLDVVYRQFSDADMCEYFSEPPCDVDEAKGIIQHYQEPDGKAYLRYGMFDKVSNEFIGTCGYHYWDQTLKQVEIGYDIWKGFWRKGYISEALPVIIQLCFNHLNVNVIYVFVHPNNIASIASVKKFGFTNCPPLRKQEDEGTTICMKLTRDTWLNLSI